MRKFLFALALLAAAALTTPAAAQSTQRSLTVDPSGAAQGTPTNPTNIAIIVNSHAVASAYPMPVYFPSTPAVTISGTVPVSGTFWQSTQAVSTADGSNIALGARADSAWTSGNATVIALLKALDRDTLLPLAAGSNVIGGVTQSGSWSFTCSSGCSSGGGTISATASSAAPSYTAGSQALSLDLYGSLRTRIENGADVAIGATNDSAWASGNGTVIGLLKTMAAAALNTSAVSTVAIDTTSPGTSNVVAPNSYVVSGNSSYSASTWQPLNLTTDGRLKVSLSSATNISPAALASTTTSANLIACQYNSGGVTLTTAQTAALQCSATGKLIAATSAAVAATDTSTNVSAATTSTQLLAANANRMGGAVVNDSTAIMYLKLGTGASSTSYDFYLAGSVSGVPTQFKIPDNWTGVVYAAWASATGSARVSERTP